MRLKSYISVYNQKDFALYTMLRNTCHAMPYQIKTILQSENRIKSWEKERLIEKTVTTNGIYYKLTDKAHKVFESKVELHNKIYSSNSPRHDAELSQYYINLYIRNVSFIYKNETDLIQERRDLLKELHDTRDKDRYEQMLRASVPDCYIEFESGQNFYFEVITDSYTKADIQAKNDYSQVTQTKINYSKI